MAAAVAAGACAIFLVLAIPDRAIVPPAAPARGGVFAWDRDAFWRALEQRFAQARAEGCTIAGRRASVAFARLDAKISALRGRQLAPVDPAFDSLETAFFLLSPDAAACPALQQEQLALYARMRDAVKVQSRDWDMSTTAARSRIYRSLYGARAAAEEVMIQHPDTSFALYVGPDAPSATPSATVHGVTVHSGDILVSRGGYPTSALIARGNDYPGNFSHVALLHVDSATREVSVVEAHIERGVVVSSAEQYLADKKLRIMVLRPRADLPAMVKNPMLPHRAASAMLARARREHIPYDFAMDYTDATALFCSEVASAAYRAQGITLWSGLSTISGSGLRRWLSEFGVTHFETEEPSDIEYDPQLVVVAEWRDPDELARDHLDNAVIDAMLERAEAGEDIPYAWWRLPLFRIAKGYSAVLNWFGKIGPVPEGMTAVAAVRHTVFAERQQVIAGRVARLARQLAEKQGYPPAYWGLVELAKASASY